MRGEEVKQYQARLVALIERLDRDGRRTLLEYAEFLASRGTSPAIAPAIERRAPGETVLQAVRRLNRSYPRLRRSALLQPVGELLSEHLVDGRAAEEIVAELEALYARTHGERGGR